VHRETRRLSRAIKEEIDGIDDAVARGWFLTIHGTEHPVRAEVTPGTPGISGA
jgi:hypothetical protein